MTRAALLDAPDPSAAPAPEIDAFLRANTRAYLFVVTTSGEVRGWPMTSMYQPGLLYFTTYRKSVKTPHLVAAGSASVVVATPEGVDPLDSVTVSGPIRVIDFSQPVIERFLDLQPDTETRVDAAQRDRFRRRLAEGKRVLIEVEVREAVLHRLEETESEA